MKKLESFLIFVNNLSDVYIFTIVTMFSVVAVALYCAKIMNRKLTAFRISKSNKKDKNSDTEDDENYFDERKLDSEDDLGRAFVREMKAANLKKVEETLSDEQIQEEKRIERQQLAAIFELLKKQEEEFNTSTMDEMELKKQLSLYR